MKRFNLLKHPRGPIPFLVDLMLKFLSVLVDSFPVLHVGLENKKGLKEGGKGGSSFGNLKFVLRVVL